MAYIGKDLIQYKVANASNSQFLEEVPGSGLVNLGAFEQSISGEKTFTTAVVISTTDALQLPCGASSERPMAPAGGIRFNFSTVKAEIFDGTVWNFIADSANSTVIEETIHNLTSQLQNIELFNTTAATENTYFNSGAQLTTNAQKLNGLTSSQYFDLLNAQSITGLKSFTDDTVMDFATGLRLPAVDVELIVASERALLAVQSPNNYRNLDTVNFSRRNFFDSNSLEWKSLVSPYAADSSLCNYIANGSFFTSFYEDTKTLFPSNACDGVQLSSNLVKWFTNNWLMFLQGTGKKVTFERKNISWLSQNEAIPELGFPVPYARFNIVSGTDTSVNNYLQIYNLSTVINAYDAVRKTYTFSFWAKVLNNYSNNNIYTNFRASGGHGSNVLNLDGKTHVLTTQWKRYTHTFTLPSSLNLTNVSNQNGLAVGFGLDHPLAMVGGIDRTIDITGCVLNEGVIPLRANRVFADAHEFLEAMHKRYTFLRQDNGLTKYIGYVPHEAYLELFTPYQMEYSPANWLNFSYRDILYVNNLTTYPMLKGALITATTTDTVTKFAQFIVKNQSEFHAEPPLV